MKRYILILLLITIAVLMFGCASSEPRDAEKELDTELEFLSDTELIDLAEKTDGGQSIAGQAVSYPGWKSVSSEKRSKMLIKHLSKRLSYYSISSEPTFAPNPLEK